MVPFFIADFGKLPAPFARSERTCVGAGIGFLTQEKNQTTAVDVQRVMLSVQSSKRNNISENKAAKEMGKYENKISKQSTGGGESENDFLHM